MTGLIHPLLGNLKQLLNFSKSQCPHLKKEYHNSRPMYHRAGWRDGFGCVCKYVFIVKGHMTCSNLKYIL